MANEHNLKPFQKNDPRINRKGRPRSFDTLRALAQQIAHDPVIKDGHPVVVNGHAITVCEAILRTWAQSKNPQLVKAFIEIAYGKVPDALDMAGVIKHIIKVTYDATDSDADDQSEAT